MAIPSTGSSGGGRDLNQRLAEPSMVEFLTKILEAIEEMTAVIQGVGEARRIHAVLPANTGAPLAVRTRLAAGASRVASPAA